MPSSPIFSVGTQVVILRDLLGQSGRILHGKGSVGVVVKSPRDLTHSYRVRFLDNLEEAIKPRDLVRLSVFKDGELNTTSHFHQDELVQRIIFRCIIGSRAYGLDNEKSDTDYRGVYLPPAKDHWSLYGVPPQLECDETQEVYWEIQKFIVLALKANPNILETLYTPLIEHCTPLGEELIGLRSLFLSKLVYQTFNGYVMSQFKKMQSDLKNRGKVKWKHVMHLIRLLLSGIQILETGELCVRVTEHKDDLISIRRGEMDWDRTEQWRKQLHEKLESAFKSTSLPDRPDYETANDFLIRAREAATGSDLP